MSREKLVVVGCGLPRTGTTSLKEALEILLGAKCYHMFTFIQEGNEEDVKHWKKALEGKLSSAEWRDFFELRGYAACVDFPPSYFFRELVQAFPEAKFVLSKRNPATWHDSVIESTMRTFKTFNRFPANILIGLNKDMKEKLEVAHHFSIDTPKGFDRSMFKSIECGKAESADFVRKWEEEVENLIPKNQLLVFEVKQGWGPLCAFMNLPVPDQPFPRANDRAEMNKNINKIVKAAWIVVIGMPIVIGLLIYVILWATNIV